MSSILVRFAGCPGPRAFTFALLLLAGCRSPEERAARFAGAYEAAMANNDPWTARMAMQQAVQYQDDNPAYWAALGRAQLALADYAGAYNAYLRANELDRSDVSVLQTLADLAVMSGHVEESRRYANQVLLVQPADPGPQSTLGFVALRDRDYENALKRADTVLAVRPADTSATILKARALASMGRDGEAVTLLKAFVADHARDQAALDTLATISGRFGDLKGQEAAQARLLALTPDDPARRLGYAGTLYALGERARAHDITLEMARSGKHGGRLIDILALWKQYEPRDRSLADARALAADASIADRMRYAYFLMLAGAPGEAEAMVAPHVALPVTPANAAPLALLAQARGLQGRDRDALSMLDAVLAFDQTNVMALRARTDLYLRQRRGADAVHDAQRLVAEKPEAADDRLRLARAYVLAGKPQLAENAYRAGMQDIPGNELLFRSLRTYLAKAGRADELVDLDQQYVEQRRLGRVSW